MGGALAMGSFRGVASVSAFFGGKGARADGEEGLPVAWSQDHFPQPNGVLRRLFERTGWGLVDLAGG
jgi:hypothetical protein